MDKVVIERLPMTKDVPGQKRWEEERGAFVQIMYREEARHLAIFEIRQGFSRGNHYHNRKEEVFYLFRGRLRALFIDMDTLEKEEKTVETGDKIKVKPRCGHTFHGLEDTLVVEYSPQVFEKEDTYALPIN
jgi:UDP-2-acetamido-2,6-beta-L-arabino-hexul-4-ose reductase